MSLWVLEFLLLVGQHVSLEGLHTESFLIKPIKYFQSCPI